MFDIERRGSTIGREVLGGVTTFMAMSYIIFVQVGLLKTVGMDGGGVMMATCLAAAAASILMGLWANYPIALAPGMGENFFFALTVVPALAAYGIGGLDSPWQMALALTVLSGAVFLLLSLVGFRSALLNAIPDSLKSGIAAGIGLFIAVVGFEFGNLVEKSPGGLIQCPRLGNNPAAWLTLIGLGVTLTLLAFRLRGSILLGILITAGVALGMGQIQWCHNPVAWPTGLDKTVGGFLQGFTAVGQAFSSPTHAVEMLVFTFVLLFMVMFDTVGTLIGVASRADLIKAGRLPRAERALAADAAGTMIGGMLGTSTVTSYIESITGVQAGARTGLAAIVAGVLMALAIFFQPLAQMIGGGVVVHTAAGQDIIKHPLIAPALIVVGSMMMRTIREVDWEDVTEYLPAFLTILTMPLHYSIAAGIAIGFVSYAFGKIVSGRARQCPVVVYIFAALFVVEYVVWAIMGK